MRAALPAPSPLLRAPVLRRAKRPPHPCSYERGMGWVPHVPSGDVSRKWRAAPHLRRWPPAALSPDSYMTSAHGSVCRECVHEAWGAPRHFVGAVRLPQERVEGPSTCRCPAARPRACRLLVSSWARGQVGFCGSRAPPHLLTTPAGRPGSLSHGVSLLWFLPCGVLWVGLGDLMGLRPPAEPCGPQPPDPGSCSDAPSGPSQLPCRVGHSGCCVPSGSPGGPGMRSTRHHALQRPSGFQAPRGALFSLRPLRPLIEPRSL